MFSPEFLRFLRSGDAIQVHLLCGTLVVVLSVSLWTGEAGDDFGWGLAFSIVAWPVLLGLMWLSRHFDQQIVTEYLEESVSAPQKLIRKRERWRAVSLGFLLVFGLVCVFAGHQGWQFDSLAADWLGYLLLVVAVLGAVGVNVWYGGPLDPRFDPSLTDEDLVADPEFTTDVGTHHDDSRPDR